MTTGIEISESEWRIVQLARAGGAISVRQRHAIRFGPLPFETDLRVAARADALKAYLKKNKLNIKAARLCISKGAVAARYRRMPPTETNAELRQMARFEAERHIPFHADRHIYDFLLMRQEELAGNDVMTVAVDAPVINEALDVCQAAGIDVAAADVSSLALYRLYRMRERPKGAVDENDSPTVALTHVGPGNLDVVIIYKGVALFTRCANVGVNQLIDALGDEAPSDISELDIAAIMEEGEDDSPPAVAPAGASAEADAEALGTPNPDAAAAPRQGPDESEPPATFAVSDDLGDMPRLPGAPESDRSDAHSSRQEPFDLDAPVEGSGESVFPGVPEPPDAAAPSSASRQETFDLDAPVEEPRASGEGTSPSAPGSGDSSQHAAGQDVAPADGGSRSETVSIFSQRAIRQPAAAGSSLFGRPTAVDAPSERPTVSSDAPPQPEPASVPSVVPPPATTGQQASARPAGFAAFARSSTGPSVRLSPEGRAAARQWFNRVVTEVGRAYDFAYREFSVPAVTTVLVSGVGVRLGGFRQQVARTLGVDVELLLEKVRPPTREKRGRNQPPGPPLECDAIAIGAALDNPSDLGPRVNLMPDEFLRKRRRRSQMASVMTTATLAVCALALGGFYLYQINRVKMAELEALRAAQRHYAPLVQEIEKMEQEIEIFDEFRNPQKNALHILNYIAGLPITQDRVKVIQFDFVQGGSLKIQGHATELKDVNELLDTLERSGYFSRCGIVNHQQISLPRRGSAQVWDFSIDCALEEGQ